MRLRHILLILSLIAFVSASTGGYLFYSSLRRIAFREAERHAMVRLAVINSSLSNLLTQNIRPVRALASLPAIQTALVEKTPETLAAANRMLDRFRKTLDVDVCYLLDPGGDTALGIGRRKGLSVLPGRNQR